MAMNISCKLEKASYNIFFIRTVTVKSLYTLRRRRRRRNEVKSIVSTGCYPVDTMTYCDILYNEMVCYSYSVTISSLLYDPNHYLTFPYCTGTARDTVTDILLRNIGSGMIIYHHTHGYLVCNLG